MTFSQAMRALIEGAWTFRGRASRSEFWWPQLALAGFGVALGFVTGLLGSFFVTMIVLLATFIVTLVVNLPLTVRRLHDTGRSAWWVLIGLVPYVGGIALYALCALPSRPEANAYGLPREVPSAAAH